MLQRSAVACAVASFVGCAEYKYSPGDRPCCLNCFLVLMGPSRQIMVYYLETRHIHTVLHSFRHITHCYCPIR
jgi:hypothetical protein